MAQVISAANRSENNLNASWQALKDACRKLAGNPRSILAIALLAAIIAAATVVVLWTSSKQYRPLYGSQEHYDKAIVLETLQQQNIAFQLDPNDGNILVAADQLPQARMQLAARGVKAALPPGLDHLDKVTGLGTSQFMETAQYTHALEGELARTVISMDAVNSARVHLAIPKRTVFVGRDEEHPSAAVMVSITQPLTTPQVEAIVNLVAGSITGLKPVAVSVVDQNGELLSAALDLDDDSLRLSNKQMDYTHHLEKNMADRAKEMLLPLLGYGNFRVQVAADVDFTQTEITRESLDGNPVLMSEQSQENSNTGRQALGIPGSLSNEPPVAAPQQAQDEQANNNQQQQQATPPTPVSKHNENNRQYQTGKAVTHTMQVPGRVTHLSVSVLLNKDQAPQQGWQPEQLQQMGDMVKTAVGFNAQRGDQFSLQSFPFNGQGDVLQQLPEEQWWQQPVWREYLRYVLGGLMLLLLIIFGIRPLVKHLVKPHEEAADEAEIPALLAETDDAEAAAEQPATANQETAKTSADAPEMTLPPPGSELEVQVKHLQMLVDHETVRVAEVVKQWMSNDERAKS